MEINISLLQPAVLLISWSILMLIWLYVTRIPAIIAADIELDPYAPSGQQMSQLPAQVRWKADNYNHLMEQPTIYYALIGILAMTNNQTEIAYFAAWSYLVFRILHSLAQAVANKLVLRFFFFLLSNITLIILTISAIHSVFQKL